MFPNFKFRKHTLELLDDPNIPAQDIYKNMQELAVINKLLGGHNITLKGIKQLIGAHKKISICEIGCGGGDNLKAIYLWAQKNNIEVNLTGVDLNEHCLKIANENNFPAQWINANYNEHLIEYDIIFCSLFCHHFIDEELNTLLQHLKNKSKIGFVINDLHRNYIAYYSIKLLTKLFSKSYLVKNDAPVSVSNGFTKKEWTSILLKNALSQAIVSWQWAFRHLIVGKHEQAI